MNDNTARLFRILPALFFSAAMATVLIPASAHSQEQAPVQEQKSAQDMDVVAEFQKIRWGTAFEIQAPIPLENGAPDADRGRVKNFEISAQSRVADSLYRDRSAIDAKLTIGAFDDNGVLTLGLREAFLQSTDLVDNFDLRVGKFFLPIGLYNQTRHSAWLTPNAPQVVTRFFGDDGIVDTGIEGNFRASRRVQLRFGVMNGYSFDSGESGVGAKPLTPTHYVRPTYDITLSSRHDLSLGLNYVGRMDDVAEVVRIVGGDFWLTPRGRRSSIGTREWSAQGEVFHRYRAPASVVPTKELGATVYVEKQVRDHFAAGFRVDNFTVTSLKSTVTGTQRDNMELGFSPNISFSKSEAFKIQAAYSYLVQSRDGDSTRREQVVELRLVSEIGSIPKLRGLLNDPSSL